MLHIIIFEDNTQLADYLAKISHNLMNSLGISAEITTRTDLRNTEELKHIYECGNIFLCDIDLGNGINGFNIAGEIKSVNPDAYIVFISGHLEYLLQAFRIHAFDFLPKPVSSKVLTRCLNDILSDIERKKKQYPANRCTVDIKTGPIVHQLESARIIMIEKQVNKLNLYSMDGVYSFYETLDSFEKRSDSNEFIRIHKGFIINRHHIKSIDYRTKTVTLTQSLTCPIGAHFKENILTTD